jgi:tRNA A-37 threonylcarbamoyl transferase component Bud32
MKQQNNWFNFLKTNRGQNLSMKELSIIYRTLQSTLLHHDMTYKELCTFANTVTLQIRNSSVQLTNLIGTGSYGLIVGVQYGAVNTACIMKVSRVCSIKLPPIRFPVLNNNRTSWHVITEPDFQRGYSNQTNLYKELHGNVRIPCLYMHTIVTLNECKFGCIIMQKIRSITLKRCLSLTKLSMAVKCYLIKKAGLILRKLHLRNIVHADYHAWNLLVDPSCHLYLIDFDRSMRSSNPKHQMHDLAMMLDSIECKYWYAFNHGYFGSESHALPFTFTSDNPIQQKQELHTQSRTLFAQYINDLRSGSMKSL